MSDQPPHLPNSPDPLKALGDRLTELEGRQNKDDADKKRDLWLKVIPIVLSAIAVIVAFNTGRASIKGTEAALRQLELKEKESLLSVKLLDVRTPGRGAADLNIDRKRKRTPAEDERTERLSFRIVNDGAPVTIEEVIVEYSMPFTMFDNLSEEEVQNMITILKENVSAKDIASAKPESLREQRLVWVSYGGNDMAEPCPLPVKLEPNDGRIVSLKMYPKWENAKVTVFTTAGKKFDFAIK